MYRILISDKLPESALGIFEESKNYEISVKLNLSENELVQIIPNYHGLLVRSGTQVTNSVITAAKNLKVIGRAGSGLDNIDVSEAEKKGIMVLNTPGSNSRAVAELVTAMLFILPRKIFLAIDSLKKHQWKKSSLLGSELMGKNLGLIGFGKIGQEVGKLASGIGMKVLVYKQSLLTKSPGYEYELVELETLLTKSDFISLHVPKSKQTINLIGIKELEQMKSSAYLINCARGGIVNENDLLTALDSDMIAGVALDVYDMEPPVDFALIDHQKVLCTPHIGASTMEAQERVGQDIVTSVMQFLETNYVFINSD
jgi:D-3-phosphoglycerate dehydrogenase / 2-oxoglutarate reductase